MWKARQKSIFPQFLKRWLDEKSPRRVQIKAIVLSGTANYLKEISRRANLDLAQPHVIGALGVLDLYGSGLAYPDGTISHKYGWARNKIESEVRHARFRQHFAVHETEAWLLSQPSILPQAVRDAIPNSPPETVNFQNPPSHRLADLYKRRLEKKYTKPLEGAKLFRALDPNVARERCPHLALLLEDLRGLAAGAEE